MSTLTTTPVVVLSEVIDAGSNGSPVSGRKELKAHNKPKVVDEDGRFRVINPDEFDPVNHFYPRVLNASIHPLVSTFFKMSTSMIVTRYCHLHPRVNADKLSQLLNYNPEHFRWAGCDTFPVISSSGKKEVVVIETNSCPSGQKSFPLLDEDMETGGYERLIQDTFLSMVQNATDLPEGGLAVIYDKNEMEASGYASVIASLTSEEVFLVQHMNDQQGCGGSTCVRWVDGVLHVKRPEEQGEDAWRPIRAAYRYVTQQPWDRIPLTTRTLVLNPVIACLAGGRNKLVASKAYKLLNAELERDETGLSIVTPETIHDVKKAEIPLWVRSMGGHAVVKVPYSNAGQGVYTITNAGELEALMAEDFHYDSFIVQSLIGNAHWSSSTSRGSFYHVGMLPDKKNRIYIADMRMMVSSSAAGIRPVAVYARQAHKPLKDVLLPDDDSWQMLGTNLSVKLANNKWSNESERLMLMDRKNFSKLGMGVDTMIDAYIQTTLCMIAIDKMAQQLLSDDGTFNVELFRSLNDDAALVAEIEQGSGHLINTSKVQ